MKSKRLLNLFELLFVFITCASCQNESTNSTNNQEKGVYYMDVINPLSSITYDYENPNYSYAFIERTSDIIYFLDSNKTYNLISPFSNILLYLVDNYVEKEINSNIDDALYIEVSFKYIISETASNDGTGYFYVFKNSMLVFLDNNKHIRYYSKTYELDYEEIKNEIVKGE